MILKSVRDPIHADLLALFAINIVFGAPILYNRHIKRFDFALTCDVTGDTVVIKICFPWQFVHGFQMPSYYYFFSMYGMFRNTPMGRGLILSKP